MKRIAILETGRPPKGLRPEYGDYADMFDRMLGEGFTTSRFDVAAGELPDPTAFDGVIITGSAAGVYEDHDWLPPLFDWIRGARGKTRMVGVCFGHQAMAQALGGRVEKSDRGWGVGLHRYDVASVEPWMQPTAASVALPASHQDQVVEQPPEARVILSSAFTPFAGLAWGQDAVSVQPHPEFSPEFTSALTAGRYDRMDAGLVDRALDSLKAPNVDAPDGYLDWIEPMPLGAEIDVAADQADLVHLFVRDRAGLEQAVASALAGVRPGGMLWVSWPKKASPLFRDLTEDGLRAVLLPTGWVDVKVCAVSADWSGLKFLKRKA